MRAVERRHSDAPGGDAYRELEEELERHVPQLEDLERALETLGRGVELSKEERVAVLRNLERVWHLMKLKRLMSEFFGDSISFGGGAVLNYIYMVRVGEKPRFTFDVDSAWRKPARAKREILAHIPPFNRWLAEKRHSLRIPVGGDRYARLWIAEYDVEKDFFPDVLSLRVPVLTRYTGEPFYSFLGIADYTTISRLREVFQRTLGVKDPQIDYLRLEISLGMPDAPTVRLETADLFGNTHRELVTEPELQLAWKILGKVGRQHENPEASLHDILKASLDLRLLKHLDAGRVREYVAMKERPERVVENSKRNLGVLRARGEALWSGHHYVLVRKTRTLEEVVNEALETLNFLTSPT